MHFPHDFLEAEGRYVMTLVDDDLPVCGYQVANLATAIKALQQRDVDGARRPSLASSNLADCLGRQIKESQQSFAPLLKEMLGVHDNQSIYTALCNQPSSDDCLAECGRRGQHANVVLHQRIGCRLLLVCELAIERDGNRCSRSALIICQDLHTICTGELKQLGQTLSGQRQVIGKSLRAINQPGFAECR